MNAKVNSRIIELRCTSSKAKHSLAKLQMRVLELEKIITEKLMLDIGMNEYKKTHFHKYFSQVRVISREFEVNSLLSKKPEAIPEDGLVVRVGVRNPVTRRVCKTVIYDSNAEVLYEHDGVFR